MNHSVSTKYGVMRLAPSHLKTHVSLLSLRLTEEKGFSSLLKHTGYMIVLHFASGIAHAGLFHYESPRERTEVTLWSSFKHLELRNINYQMRQHSGLRHLTVFHGALEGIQFPKVEKHYISSLFFMSTKLELVLSS